MRSAILLSASLLFVISSYGQQFNAQEKAKILSGDTSTMLQVVQTTVPAELKILHTVSVNVDVKDELLPILAQRMYKAMRDTANPGIGIAAPQVGINRNVIWVQRFDKEGMPFELYLNPKITWQSKLMRKGKEGCLSIPDITGDVLRHYTIALQYTDINGIEHDEIVEGFTAVVFQHEIDHINGVLFTERMLEQKKSPYQLVNDKVNFYLEELPER